MIQIRRHIFETNSSSTHTLILCSDDEYKAFVEGKLYYCQYFWKRSPVAVDEDVEFKPGKFYSVEEVDNYYAILNKNNTDKNFKYTINTDGFFVTYTELIDHEFLESFDEEYTSEHGDIVHAFGVYGYDG